MLSVRSWNSVAFIEASLEELPVSANLGQSCLATKISAPGPSIFGWFRHTNRRSKVWQYFEPNLVAVDDNFKAVCKYCGLHLSTKSGTSSLRTHISEYCPAIDDASRKGFISTMKKQPTENFVFDPQLSREHMIEYIVHAEIPFNKFEDPYFERWIKSV